MVIAAVDLSVGQKRDHAREGRVDCHLPTVLLVSTVSAGELYHEWKSCAIHKTTGYPLLSVVTL